MPAHRRRWLIVAALFAVTFGISMPLAAYGVFLPVIAEAFGWSRGALSTALSVNLVVGGMAGLLIGTLADRHGPRAALLATVIFAGVGFGLVATVGALWQVYLFVGGLAGIGMSSFYVLSASTVTRWFDDRRGLAIALVLSGFNIGYIVAGPLAAWLIGQVGWRAAYALLGGGCGVIALVAASSVRLPRGVESDALRAALHADAPRIEHGHGVTVREALADPRQWCMNVSWLLLGGVLFMLGVHAVPFARDRGVTLASASLMLTAYGLGAVIGRLSFGPMSDRAGIRATMIAGYVVELVAVTAFALAPGERWLLAAMLAFGVGAAATDTLMIRALPEVFGMRALGAITALFTFGWRWGAAAGPATAGFLYDVTGSYTIPFALAPAAVVLSAALFLAGTARGRITPRPRRLRRS